MTTLLIQQTRIADALEALLLEQAKPHEIECVITKAEPFGAFEGDTAVYAGVSFEFLADDNEVLTCELLWSHPDRTTRWTHARLIGEMRDALRIPNGTTAGESIGDTVDLVGQKIGVRVIGKRVIGFEVSSVAWMREKMR
jgi:hypothetical protein